MNFNRVTWFNEHDQSSSSGTVVAWVQRGAEPWAVLVEDGRSTFRSLPIHRLTIEAIESSDPNITPAMIRAGANVLAHTFDGVVDWLSQERAASVYRAMEAARRKKPKTKGD